MVNPKSDEFEVFNLLSKLVALETVNDPQNQRTPKPESLELVQSFFEASGLTIEIRQFNSFSSQRASLGVGRPHVLILGHLDVVPFIESQWKTDPMMLARSRENPAIAFGRGAHDDKGGVTAMLLAARRLAPQISSGTVSFLVTTDEEVGGGYGAGAWASYLKEINQTPDFVINTDGGVDMKLVGRRRGVFAVEVRVPRKEVIVRGLVESLEFDTSIIGEPTLHAAYFRPGSDRHALLAASKVVQKEDLFVRTLDGSFLKGNVIPNQVTLQVVRPYNEGDEHTVDLNLTKLVCLLGRASRLFWNEENQSEYGINITPNVLNNTDEGSRVRFDVRTFCTDEERIRHEFESCFKAIEGTTVAIGFGGGLFFTPFSSPLLQSATDVANKLGLNPTVIEQEGASDSRFFASEGIPCVELAPRGGNIHSPNEWVDLDTIACVSRFYEILTLHLLRQQS